MQKRTMIVVYISLIVVISFIVRSKTNFILEETNSKKESIESTEEENEIIINVLSNNEIVNLNLEDYVIGVVACEMPASFNIEALKAQAVASRTFVLNRRKDKQNYIIKDDTSAQCFQTQEEMQNKWKTNYEKYYNKIKNAVYETKGMYLTYKDKIITAFYFSMSNGYTEASENVFSSSRAYLKSVESKWEINHKDFEKTITITIEDLKKKLGLKDNKIQSINILNRYDTNRVKEVEINNKIYTGVEFRKLLGLRSTDFDIEYNNKSITITTRGYGHGVGMSQYGANGMASLGYTYDEILKYYYKDIEIKKYN